MIGVAGTVTTLAAAVLDLAATTATLIHHSVLPSRRRAGRCVDRLLDDDGRAAQGAALHASRPRRRHRCRRADPGPHPAPYDGRPRCWSPSTTSSTGSPGHWSRLTRQIGRPRCSARRRRSVRGRGGGAEHRPERSEPDPSATRERTATRARTPTCRSALLLRAAADRPGVHRRRRHRPRGRADLLLRAGAVPGLIALVALVGLVGQAQESVDEILDMLGPLVLAGRLRSASRSSSTGSSTRRAPAPRWSSVSSVRCGRRRATSARSAGR